MTGELEDPLALGVDTEVPVDGILVARQDVEMSTIEAENLLLFEGVDACLDHIQQRSIAPDGPKCVHCGADIGRLLSTSCDAGMLHNECVAAYHRVTQERCAYCANVLRASRKIVGAAKLHPECVESFKSGKTYVAPRMCGMAKKFSIGRSMFGRRNWQDRFFVLSIAFGGLAYFESEADAVAYEGGSKQRPPKGVALLSTATSRIISMPTFHQHPKATSASKELIIVFHEDGNERRLLLQFVSWEERSSWLAVLETYVHNIDDLKDYEET
jgi:hypothetical protein